jgi:hypothetical protein
MGDQITVKSSGHRLSLLGKVPWGILIVLYMAAVHMLRIPMQGVAGYIFIGLCVVVLFAEFFKSGDTGPVAFLVDLLGAVASVVVATVLISYLIMRTEQAPTFFDWLGCAVIAGDAVLGPFNAFRTALRNIGVGSLG